MPFKFIIGSSVHKCGSVPCKCRNDVTGSGVDVYLWFFKRGVLDTTTTTKSPDGSRQSYDHFLDAIFDRHFETFQRILLFREPNLENVENDQSTSKTNSNLRFTRHSSILYVPLRGRPGRHPTWKRRPHRTLTPDLTPAGPSRDWRAGTPDDVTAAHRSRWDRGGFAEMRKNRARENIVYSWGSADSWLIRTFWRLRIKIKQTGKGKVNVPKKPA